MRTLPLLICVSLLVPFLAACSGGGASVPGPVALAAFVSSAHPAGPNTNATPSAMSTSSPSAPSVGAPVPAASTPPPALSTPATSSTPSTPSTPVATSATPIPALSVPTQTQTTAPLAVPIAPAIAVLAPATPIAAAPPLPIATATPQAKPTATTAPTQVPATQVPLPPLAIAPPQTRPFASGPFNNAVVSPQIDPNSASYLASVMGGDFFHIGKLQFSTNAHGPTDGNPPIYVSHNSDPVYTIHCMYYSGCPLEGVQEHIPVGAVAAGNSGNTSFLDDGHDDMHMAVRNADTGVEIDTWLTPQPSGFGGTLNVGYGGQYATSSGGYNQPGGATAAGFALSVGRIRAVDLQVGRIPYALFLVAPCENGHVAPASGNDAGGVAGCPPLGAHVWLDSTAADIAASGAAPSFQVIMRALHEFGGYIGNRCTSCNLTLGLEGGLSATAFGSPNPWSPIASRFPAESPSGTPAEYHILVSSGSIDLSAHLHVITN